MKKAITMFLCLLLMLTVCACASSPSPAAADAQADPADKEAAVEPTPKPTAEPTAAPTLEPTPEPTPEPTATPEPLSPYNWLGYPEIPQCNYLDLVCSQHYYREYTSYITLGGDAVGATYIEAIDDRNTYTENMNGGRTYFVDGLRYSVNERNKTYLFDDWTELYAAVPNAAEKAASNINTTGKEFQGTGKAIIPMYETVDPAEYEYYEYLTNASSEMSMTERVYLRDGDVFAIYTGVKSGEQLSEITYVTTLITGDIPEGLFEVPDLSGYTQK